MKYFESGKINVYPSGFRSANYKQSKLTTEENITHLQNFMSTSDGLYIDYIDYSKNHTSADPSIVQITNANAGSYFYKDGNKVKVNSNTFNNFEVSNDYFILRVCGYSFRFKIIDFLTLCANISFPSESPTKYVYGYVYLRDTESDPIGYVLGNVDTPSTNVLDQGLDQDALFQGLGIGSGSELGFNYCYKVKIGKFDSTNHFTISYDPIQVVNATADESGNNIKATYAHSLIKTAAANPNTNGDTLSLKNNLNENLPESSFEIEIVNAKHAASSNKLDAAPSLGASGSNKITVTAGGRTSDAFTVPYAIKATGDGSGNIIKETYGSSLSCSDATITLNNKNAGGLSSVTVDNVQNSSYASKIKTSKAIGGVNNPVYVDSNGTVTAGKFIPKLNGSDQDAASSFYAPTSAGTRETILLSDGVNKAPVWSNTSKGSPIIPLYLDSTGVLKMGSQYAGGTKVTLNGSDKGSADASIYAAESAKDTDKNKLLKCNGINKAPTWIAQSELSVGSATKATQDASGNNIQSNYAHSLTLDNATYTTDTKIYLKAKNNTILSNISLFTVKNSITSKIKNGSLEITKSSDVDGYNIYTAALYGLNELQAGTFLTVYVTEPSNNEVKFTINVMPGRSITSLVYLNGRSCNSTNTLSADTLYNAYYTGSNWNFTPAKTNLISGTSVTLNGADKQGEYISIYAPTSAGKSGQILKSNGGGAPTWINQSDLSVGKATKADNIYVIDGTVASGAGTSGYKSIKSVTSLPTSPDANTLYIVVEA